ncbi:MAG TPA: PIN domain-containing protein [Terracidiphilus sp.]|nr:PIN domain-containing protein [Terracidiphilus sp.]
MTAKAFIDTNVLVYAHDIDAGQKHQIAKKVLIGLSEQRAGALSMQVLQEFYVTVTRKIASPLSKDDARAIVEDFSNWCVLTTPEDIRQAFLIEDGARIEFWDALIVAAAVRSGATRILSEDLHQGQTIAGIPIENPFLVS